MASREYDFRANIGPSSADDRREERSQIRWRRSVVALTVVLFLGLICSSVTPIARPIMRIFGSLSGSTAQTLHESH